MNIQRVKKSKKEPHITSKSITFTSLFALFLSSELRSVSIAYSAPVENRIARVGHWLAFGSGCRGAADQEKGNVKFKSKYGASIHTQFFPESFKLELAEGAQGVRECAFRVSIEPPPDVRIRHVQARVQVLATKSDLMHLRSRVLLLMGDSLLATKTWDLGKQTFARQRSEEMILTPGERTEMPFPKLECGRPAIVGLDVTFEGKSEGGVERRKQESNTSYLQLLKNTPAEIEVFFEECKK